MAFVGFEDSAMFVSMMTTDEVAGLIGWSEPKARNITGQQTHSTYAAEVFDSTGKGRGKGEGRGRWLNNRANPTLTSRMIPAGRYLIKLYGLRDEKQEPVDDCPGLINYQ